MIPTDELRLEKFTESHDEDGLKSAVVTVRADDGRRFTARAGRVDDDIGLIHFADSANDVFVRSAFGVLWYCVEEFFERDIDLDLGPLSPSAGHAPGETTYQEVAPEEFDDQDEDTDTDTPQAAEAPQPTDAAVSDGGAVPATQHAPGTLGPVSPETQCDDDVEVGDEISDLVDEDDEDVIEACPECDDSHAYPRETKPDDERWRCPNCGSTFAEPVVREKKTSGPAPDGNDVDLPEERPQWLAGSPEEIVADSRVHTDLDGLVSAVILEPDVANVSRHLGRSTSTVRGGLLQPLGLIDADGALLDGETLDERLDVITRWDDE